ncbi:MAG: (d)CMP kinase [bacterium]
MTGGRLFSIAIDGPAGAGKSTIAMLLARRFGLSYVDTGAMYRGVALLCRRNSIDPANEEALASIAERAGFHFEMDPSPDKLLNRVSLNGEDVTDAVREPEISSLASSVSALSGVRRALVAKQKLMGAQGGVVMEGRDICNVVLPLAEVKIFLTASAEVRAGRRHLEFTEKGKSSDYERTLAEIRERDHRDSTRADSPLHPAADAVIVDTDPLSIEQVVDSIAEIAREKTGA